MMPPYLRWGEVLASSIAFSRVGARMMKTCLDSGKFAAEVSKDMEEGMKAGVNGTPSFFINGIPVAGAQRYEVFSEIIDRELARPRR
jgi:protein-disulfide isomerase